MSFTTAPTRTARERLTAFNLTFPTPEEARQPWVKALEAEAKAEWAQELLTNPAAMLQAAGDLEASAERHDATAADFEQMARTRRDYGNDDEVAQDHDLSARAARNCAQDARVEAVALRVRAATVTLSRAA